jgi:exo-beta-1,3-glucanase (GH17 family)
MDNGTIHVAGDQQSFTSTATWYVTETQNKHASQSKETPKTSTSSPASIQTSKKNRSTKCRSSDRITAENFRFITYSIPWGDSGTVGLQAPGEIPTCQYSN